MVSILVFNYLFGSLVSVEKVIVVVVLGVCGWSTRVGTRHVGEGSVNWADPEEEVGGV